MTISIGFDPEYLVQDRETAEIVPICGKLGGTKGKARPFLDPRGNEYPGYAYHEDNVAAELNVPATNQAYDAHMTLSKGRRLLTSKLRELGLGIAPCAEHEFAPKHLRSKKAQEFGCDPDFDAYTGGKSPRLDVPEFGNWRFGGGHIHLGGDFNCPPFVAVLFLDLMLGTYLVEDKKNSHRRAWYGQPGVYRPKPYGIEYRSLSNQWTRSDTASYEVCCVVESVGRWLESATPLEIKKVFDKGRWTELREVLTREPHRYDKTVIRGLQDAARSRGMGA